MLKTKTITLVLGRSGTGKTCFANTFAKKLNLNILKTYTTRPQRDDEPDDTNHIFIKSEDADKYTDKFAPAVINGYEYFMTKDQIINSDIIIIEPSGIKPIVDAFPDICFNIVYIQSESPETAVDMIMSRNIDPEKAVEIYKQRLKDEDEVFTDFENQIDNTQTYFASNCTVIHRFINDYNQETMNAFINNLSDYIHFRKQVTLIVEDYLLNTDKIRFNKETNAVKGTYRNKTGTLIEVETPISVFIENTMCDRNQFYSILADWLVASEEIPIPAKRKTD